MVFLARPLGASTLVRLGPDQFIQLGAFRSPEGEATGSFAEVNPGSASLSLSFPT